MTKNTHKKMILAYMREYGKITPMEAWDTIGCTKLSTRIGELRCAGYHIIKTRTEGVNRFGQPTHYMTYRLREGE